MKRKLLPLLLATVLALGSVLFMVSAQDDASQSPPPPTVYTYLTFDELTAGDIYNRDDKTIANLADGNIQVVSRETGNNCIKWEKGTKDSTNSQFTIMPYYAQYVLGENHDKQELVISWDMYVHGNDGKNFVILSARTFNGSAWKWGPDITLTAPDDSGVGTVVSNNDAGTVTEKGKVKYDQWNTFTIVWKPDTSETRTADKADLYINGELAVQDHTMTGYKIRQLAIGNFAKGEATDTCYWMKDNLRIYSGNRICTDEELRAALETEAPTEAPTTEPATTEEPTTEPTATEAPTEEITAPKETEVKTEAKTEAKTEVPANKEEKGCASSVLTVGALAIIVIPTATICILKKKEQ